MGSQEYLELLRAYGTAPLQRLIETVCPQCGLLM